MGLASAVWGWHPTHVALAGWGRIGADWTLACEEKLGGGVAQLDSLYTVRARIVAWHGGCKECSVALHEWNEIRLCAEHALWVVRRLPCMRHRDNAWCTRMYSPSG